MQISMSLSRRSIRSAINKLKTEKEELKRKTSIFVQRLAEVGIETIDSTGPGLGDSDFSGLNSFVQMGTDGSTVTATLFIQGRDVAFIEFGAGVFYNGNPGGSPNPQGTKVNPPMTIGSFGKGHGLEDSWWYKDDSGQWHESHGTQATMPMYRAEQEIIKKFQDVAQEVFGDAKSS